jgi:hypothetical protein
MLLLASCAGFATALTGKTACDSTSDAPPVSEAILRSMWVEQFKDDTRLAAHEFAHALKHCLTGNSDPSHTDPEVYGAGGFVERIAALYTPRQ